jgi:hypothetical protein
MIDAVEVSIQLKVRWPKSDANQDHTSLLAYFLGRSTRTRTVGKEKLEVTMECSDLAETT